MENIKTDKNGFKYFDQLPSGWRTATVDDFYNRNGLFMIGKAYLVQSYYTGIFETYRTITISGFNRLKPWIEDGRVFIQ